MAKPRRVFDVNHKRGSGGEIFGIRPGGYWFRVKLYESLNDMHAEMAEYVGRRPESTVAGSFCWRGGPIPRSWFLGIMFLAQEDLPKRTVIHESVHVAVRAVKKLVDRERLVMTDGAVGVRSEELVAYISSEIAETLIDHLESEELVEW
ncbi:hypothetical protein SEA_PHINKBODEN_132 [Gordonia Phage PhinkBoden]|nr:hypothetical protein SEA_PHINKBODEN_132 [Gordonia Phage PhinkBoden]WNM66402.1 hypothetical protein SEA_CULVER_132 [Gordonia phage Culver]